MKMGRRWRMWQLGRTGFWRCCRAQPPEKQRLLLERNHSPLTSHHSLSKEKPMDKRFDELSKSLAEGVSRREALRKFGFTLTVLAVLVTVVAAPLSAQTCTTDPQNGPSIQQAVNSGCVDIRVKPGTYRENVVIPTGRTVSI